MALLSDLATNVIVLVDSSTLARIYESIHLQVCVCVCVCERVYVYV
jgi:hypothetical protein